MAKALFASTTYVKKKSIISGSVDPDKMVQFIENCTRYTYSKLFRYRLIQQNTNFNRRWNYY